MQLSLAAESLDEELSAWRNRPLGGFPYLILDARQKKVVRHGGTVIPPALLLAIGISQKSKRSVLGVSVSPSEAEVHWRAFLASLPDRGLHGVRYVGSDEHTGLREARQARLYCVACPGNCQFHLQRNAMKQARKVARRPAVAADVRAVFNASDRAEVERRLLQTVYATTAPRLSTQLEANVPEVLTVFLLLVPSGENADDDPAGADQQGDQSPDACGDAPPERSVRPATGPRRC